MAAEAGGRPRGRLTAGLVVSEELLAARLRSVLLPTLAEPLAEPGELRAEPGDLEAAVFFTGGSSSVAAALGLGGLPRPLGAGAGDP